MIFIHVFLFYYPTCFVGYLFLVLLPLKFFMEHQKILCIIQEP